MYSLLQFFRKPHRDAIQDTALLIVGFQHEQTTPETKAAGHRQRRLAPAFRRAGINLHAVCDGESGLKTGSPLPGSMLWNKKLESAFAGTGLAAYLHENKKTNVLLCGTPFNKDVFETALDARRNGFTVTIVSDFCANTTADAQKNVSTLRRRLEQEGVQIAEASAVLASYGLHAK